VSNFIDLAGQKFHKLTVIEYAGKDKWNQSRWLCQCSCGKTKIILGYCLTRGTTCSCGCLRKEAAKKNNITHGYRKTRLYRIWRGMINRCANPNDRGYYNYGGRGISVCSRWLKFENFLQDMGEPPSSKHSIDRIDNNDGYRPANCRWATHKENSRNKRYHRYITHCNKTKLLIEWAEEISIPYSTLWKRVCKYGWSIEDALTTPVRGGRANA